MASKFKANHLYFTDATTMERKLIVRICDTGKEQLKRRRKAGLSSFYAKDGKIIEVFPNNSERTCETVKSNWIILEKGKRSFKLN